MTPEIIAALVVGFAAGIPVGWTALSVKIKVHKAKVKVLGQSKKAGNWAAAGAGAVMVVVALAYVGLNAIGVM